MIRKLSVAIIAFSMLGGCQTAAQHAEDVNAAKGTGDNITVGKVQREIGVGMSSADVVGVLGSPNMVTTDDKRREVWVYDKISTDTAYSQDGAFGSILILGGSFGTGARSTTQKTLTIIIKFDEGHKVRDFAYHSSKF